MKQPVAAPDRLSRSSVPFVAAVWLLASAVLAPAQAQQLPKVGYLGFCAAGRVHPLPEPDERARVFGGQGRLCGISLCRRTCGGAPRLAGELIDARVDVIIAMGETRRAPFRSSWSPAMRSQPASSRASLVQAATSRGSLASPPNSCRSAWPSFVSFCRPQLRSPSSTTPKT